VAAYFGCSTRDCPEGMGGRPSPGPPPAPVRPKLFEGGAFLAIDVPSAERGLSTESNIRPGRETERGGWVGGWGAPAIRTSGIGRTDVLRAVMIGCLQVVVTLGRTTLDLHNAEAFRVPGLALVLCTGAA
jgi:hypothetical protein